MKKTLLWMVLGAAGMAAAGPFDQFGDRAPLPERQVAADPAARLTVFQPDWLKPVLPDAEARPGETEVKLQSFAARGEYEGFVFAVRSDRPALLRFEVAPFTSGGVTIGPEWYELRVQRTLETHQPIGQEAYVHTPIGMDRLSELALPAGETTAVFLDVRVPDDAAPGLYTSRIVITGAAEAVTLPVTLRVLPFELVRDTRSYGSYFNGRYLSDPVRGRYTYASVGMLDKVARSHRAYGFNSAQFCEVSPKLAYADGVLTADFSELEALMAAWRGAGNDGMVSVDIRFPGWWCDELAVVLEERYTVEPERFTVAGLEAVYPTLNRVEANLKARWSRDYRLSETAKDLYRQLCRQAIGLVERHGWEKVYFVVDEELGNGGLKLWGFEQFTPVLREFPGAKVMLFDNSPHLGVDLGHKYDDWIDIRQYNLITPELVAAARADGKPLWYYNRGWSRAAFGFPVWKLGAEGVHMWADQWTDHSPYGERQPAYNVWSVFYPSPSGPLPTLEGVRAREGIDDLAYLDTLADRIARLEAAGKPDGAARARRMLEQLHERLPLTNAEFNDYNRQLTPAGAFAERWKLAAEIVRLDRELDDGR